MLYTHSRRATTKKVLLLAKHAQPSIEPAPHFSTSMRVVDARLGAMTPSSSSSSSSSSSCALARSSALRATRPVAVDRRRHRFASHRARTPSLSRALPDDVDPEAVQTWQLWFGFFAGLSPVVIAAYEFGKRVLIQRRCARCAGSGLIVVGAGAEARKVKCASCGGFLPWESWSRFLSSDPGNGGRLRAPRGQTRVLYDVEASVEASRRAVETDAREDDE